MDFLADLILQKHLPRQDSIALLNTHYKISYAELKRNVYDYAFTLKEIGIDQNNYVPILCENNKEFIILVLALWLVGAIPVPLNTRLTESEIEKILNVVRSNRVLIYKNLREYNFSDSINQIKFPFDSKTANNDFTNKLNQNLDNTAVVIFTSGSTGYPKGVELSFSNLLKNAEIGNNILLQGNNDRWLASLPFYHIGGFSIITRALHYGAGIIIPDSLDTKDLVILISNMKPTLASFVSTQLKRLIDSKIRPNAELKNILLGGGFIGEDLIDSAIKEGWNITTVYGSSETSSFITANTGKDLIIKKTSAGKPLYPNEINIIDSNGKILPPYVSGEIVVKSGAVMKGYLNNPEESGKKLKDGFYYTGDIGYLDKEGFLFVEARRNDLIITGGENVNPNEVEREILKHPDVRDCSVIGLEDKIWGHIIAAAVISDKDSLAPNEITQFLSKSLAGYKIPKKIIFLKSLPKTSLGKVEKEKLKTLF